MKRLLILAAIFIIPATVFAQRLPRDVLPVHYDLTFTPNLAEETFDGSETIVVSVQRPTREIILNAMEITFKSAIIESQAAFGSDAEPRTQSAEVALDPAREFAMLKVQHPVQPGPATIRIEYKGKLNRDLRGFYIGNAGTRAASNGRRYVASQGEATDIRRAFPAFDEPAMKATFAITVLVNKQDTAISNSAVVSDTPGPGPDQHTIKFATTPRLSSYLIALLVGDFDCLKDEINGIPLGVCALGDRAKLGGFALETTKGVLAYFDTYYGIPYPFDKLDQIGIPDFAAGAMENNGAIVYRESVLLSDPKTASFARRKAIAATISHEIAHMWFGDLVTMRWWEDVWLNEGFATWMETKPLKKMHPDWRFDLDEIDDTRDAMDTDVLSNTRPIREDAETGREIDALFDSIAYQKTASLLRMIESYLGEENFRSGVNSYLKKHAFDNAESYDFFDALSSVSENSADEVMNDFVNQAGVPILSVTQRCEGNETVLRIRQRRFFANPQADPTSSQHWVIPVCSSSGESCLLLRDQEQSFRSKDCKGPIFLNRNGTGYFITEYDLDTEEQWVRQVASLKEPERMVLARDEWYLVRSGARPLGDYLQLAEALRNDRIPQLQEDLLRNLQTIADYMTAPADAPIFQAWVKSQLKPVLNDLETSGAGNETVERRLIRGYVLKALAVTAKDPQSAAVVRRMAESYLRDRSSLDPDLANMVLEAAVTDGDARLYDAVVNAYRAGGTPEEQRRFLSALAEFRNPALLQRTMEFAMTDAVRNQDSGRLMGAVMKNPAGTRLGWSFVKSHWNEITGKLSDALQLALVESTESVCDAEQRDDVKVFFAEHPVPGSDRDLAQALENMSICISNKSVQSQNLSNWLKSRP